jgi:hypothetical protein
VCGPWWASQEDLRIVVPNQKEDLLVKLIGRCWERGMYIVAADEAPLLPDPFMVCIHDVYI